MVSYDLGGGGSREDSLLTEITAEVTAEFTDFDSSAGVNELSSYAYCAS